MERYTKEQRVIIVRNFITKLNLALLLGHPVYTKNSGIFIQSSIHCASER